VTGGGAGLGKRRERGVEGRGKWRRGKGRAPQVTVEPGPLRALLRHCRRNIFYNIYTAVIGIRRTIAASV